MVQKKLQVFVSSTYTDMRDERQAAVEAILRAGHIPAGMELFAAGDESQWEAIRRWIDDSDVFMLMLGGRYGSLEPKTGKSYIQLEYEYALEKKKPFFAAVIAEDNLNAKLRLMGTDAIERDNGHLLKEFRATITSKMCRFFDDAKDVKIIVFESLGKFIQYESLTGWVPGSELIDMRGTLEEMNRLKAENTSYIKELSELKARLTATPETKVSVVDYLGEDAKALLLAAAKGDGHIMYLRHLGGAQIGVSGGKALFSGNNKREEARWKAAIEELRDQGLAEDPAHKGEVFRLTHLGYQVAEEIEGKSEPEIPNVAANAKDV